MEAHGDKVAGFLVEPIQGEAGIVVPDDNYLSEIRALCDKHNVLLICDEIQTGIARTGKLLCHEWSGIKPRHGPPRQSHLGRHVSSLLRPGTERRNDGR